MKKLFVLLVVILFSVLNVFADFQYPSSKAAQFNASINNVLFKFIVLNQNEQTVTAQFVSAPTTTTSIKFPSTVTYNSKEWTVTEIQNGAVLPDEVTDVVIPASVVAIDYDVFRNYSTNKTGYSLILEPSQTTLEFTNTSILLSNFEINRNIYHNETQMEFKSGVNGTTIKVGSDVTSIDGKFFNKLNVTTVEFENWNKWYYETELSGIEAVPYISGNVTVKAGGFTIKSIEFPEGLTRIPDFKNVGLKFEGEVTLPESVKELGKYAFYGQKNLYYINLPEGLTLIDDYAFAGCDAINFDSFPASLISIGDYAFRECNMITEITLPENLEKLGTGVFRQMESLSKATMLSKLTEIPEELFAGCNALYTVYLPIETTRIGACAFVNTKSMEEILLPKTVEYIGNGAFAYCEERPYKTLTEIIGRYKIDQEKSGAVPNDKYTYGNEPCGSLTKITFPESLREIGCSAFCNQNLYNIELNEGLTTINPNAFYLNLNLTNLRLPSTLTTIGAGAFAIPQETMNYYYPTLYSSTLSTVIIPDAVTSIGKSAFARIIGNIEVGAGITELPEFSLGYPSIVSISSEVTNIDSKAIGFTCDKVTSGNPLRSHFVRVLIMKSAQKAPIVSANFDLQNDDFEYITLIVPDGSIDTYTRNPRWKVFDTNKSMVEESQADVNVYVDGSYPLAEEIRLQSGIHPSRVVKMKVTGKLTESDWRPLRENMLSLISLDLSAIENTTIPAGALMNMSTLSSVKLPSKLTAIPDQAFYGCSLVDIPELPESVETIGNSAFTNCRLLFVSQLPAKLKSIGDHAFNGCLSLRRLSFGTELSSLGKNGIFTGCRGLEYVDLSASEFTSIPDEAFMDCSALISALLPNSITKIGHRAFKNSGLEILTLPVYLKELGAEAFYSTKLRTIDIPEGVAAIAGNTFSNCTRLVSANFPRTTTSVGTDIFANSLRVSGISCANTEAPNAQTGAFDNMRIKNCSLTVPQQSYRQYLNAPQWGRFSDLLNRMVVIEFPEDIEMTAIDEGEYQEIISTEELVGLYASGSEDENEELDAPQKVKHHAAAALFDGQSYVNLFNGAAMGNPDSKKGTRFFLHPASGKKVSKVTYNGVDITDRIEDNSIVLTGLISGNLKVYTEQSSIDDIAINDSENDLCTVYDTMGQLVLKGYESNLSSILNPGIYIVKFRGETKKIVVR